MERRYEFLEVLICLGLFLNLTACTATPSAPTHYEDLAPSKEVLPVIMTPTGSTTELIFDEEFSGTQLNAEYWSTQMRWGRTNEPELQYYSPDALKLENGFLRITADRIPMNGKEYMSGVIASYDRFAFRYGYLEMRGKIPAGQGLWPAFWMYLNREDGTGEIDIFEFLGHEPNIIHMAYHYPELKQFWFNGPDYSKDFHTYAVDWQPDHIIWYIDDVERARATTSIPSEPMYIILNLSVGGAWPGNPDESTPFPATYIIDYIRVFQNKK